MRKTLTLLMMFVLLNITLPAISARSADAFGQTLGKTSVIKSYNETKKFGFIKDDQDGKQIYFNESGLIDKPVNQGDQVKYDVIDGRNGPQAVNIKKL